MRVGFLGTGRMGSMMARHVLAAGHETTVWNRTPEKAAALVERGARLAESPADAAAGADTVVLMLSGPDAVRSALLDAAQGVVAADRKGQLVIDCTTIGPAAAGEFARESSAAGLRYVDAPVIGSVGPASEGTLAVLIGGTDSDVTQAMPLVRLWGDEERIKHTGDVGSANALKVVINLTLGVVMQGLGEALRLAHDLEVDLRDA